MRFFLRFCWILAICMLALVANATHNRAGEITYVQTGPLSIRATITTYTKTSSTQADRPELDMSWGDGTKELVQRTTFRDLPNDIRFNTYVKDHTYPSVANYVVSMADANRNENVLNIRRSIDEVFFIQTQVKFLNQQFQGPNNSPILLQPPIDVGFVGQIFTHTPNAYDPDGDSIAYELTSSLRAVNTPANGWVQVNFIAPGPNNVITLNPITGMITWNAPQQKGEYNIAILVKSYRKGLYLGAILRDMQIRIEDNKNRPPVVQAPDELCVTAGTLINFEVTARDPDIGQSVRLSATGGPFLVPNKATFSQETFGNPVKGRFEWQTNCNNIQLQPYQVVFKAEDDYNPPGTNLRATRIKVVPPPPINVTATAINGGIQVCWPSNYACASSSLFRGYTVWRKNGCFVGNIDPCATTAEGLGFTKINQGVITTANSGSNFCFTDNNVQSGGFYSYTIVAHFAPLSSAGYPFNAVVSAPAQPVCVQVRQDLPLITNVDVIATDNSNGQIFVRWTRPKALDLDTILNPGPYTFVLLKKDGFSGANTEIYRVSQPAFWQIKNLTDTTFTDQSLNTVQNPYNYAIEFYVQSTRKLGATQASSSIFLTVSPTDKENQLSWRSEVSWSNFKYFIYRKNPSSAVFVLIDSTTTLSYNDKNLVNGQDYCYYIEGKGSYTASRTRPLINKSQQVCAIPRDNVAPCPPQVRLFGCQNSQDELVQSQLNNAINWDINLGDDCSKDIDKFYVYYSPTRSGTYTILDSIARNRPFEYLHKPSAQSLVGCYYLKARDVVDRTLPVPSGGNLSAASDTLCAENCPRYYDLPNTFTPNGDGKNDLFTPFKHRTIWFIDRIELKIFNRWGQQVFSTTDPMINWDGKHETTGEKLPDGNYQYVLEIYELQSKGVVKREKTTYGYVNILSSN